MILFYLEWDCISISLSSSIPPLTFYLSIHGSVPCPPPVIWQLPVLRPRWRRSIALSQARDERQIKTTLFPLSPSHRARLNLRFFIFFFIFLLSLELPGITWNLAVSQLDDAVSLMHKETESLLLTFFFSL